MMQDPVHSLFNLPSDSILLRTKIDKRYVTDRMRDIKILSQSKRYALLRPAFVMG